MYPDRRVTLVEGEETLRSWAKFWFERALFCSNQRMLQSAARAEWEAAGRPAGSGLILPYKLYLQTPEHAIIAADTGVGKTRFVLEHFLREGLHREYRLYFVAPNHDKERAEVERDYLKLAADMKIDNANVVVFEGLKLACKPPEERYRTMALAMSAKGLSPTRSVCTTCPAAGSCSWLLNNAQKGPGLKIIVQQFLGTKVPALGKSEGLEKRSGANLGLRSRRVIRIDA